MNDIAKTAGVSRATVSFVLNGKCPKGVVIGQDARQRVAQAAEKLNYRPNQLARAVVTGKNRMIGFLTPALESAEHLSRMLAGTLDEAEKLDYTVKVLRLRNSESENSSQQIVQKVIEQCIELRLAGVAAVHLNDETALEQMHQGFTRHGMPLVILDSSFPHNWGIRVISDDYNGTRTAVEHLIGLGHRRIAFVAGRPESGSSALREAGFRAALANHEITLPAEYVIHGEWDATITDREVVTLLTLPQRPTALVCASDHMALAAQRAARRAGLPMPDELSIIGYGDLERIDLADPPLTSVSQPFEEIGATAVRNLLTRVKPDWQDPIDQKLEKVLPARLVVRESTAAPAI